jgi:predicted phosphodiesterase
MRLLCFSDVHGNVDAVKTMLGDVHRRGVHYDAFIFAGDMTNMSSLKKMPAEKQRREARFGEKPRYTKAYKAYTAERNERYFKESERTARKILALLTAEQVPLYYIFGNRDRHGGYDLGTVKNLYQSEYAICLDHVKKALIRDGIYISNDERRVDRHTIFIQHSPGKRDSAYRILSKSLLHVTAHTHQAIVYDHYLNTGFLYRDETRGARPSLGGYFDVTLHKGKLTGISFNKLGKLYERKFVQNDLEGTVYSAYRSYFPFRLVSST